MRWALNLSELRYVFEHIPRERNVWADILTRWAIMPIKEIKVSRKSIGSKSLMIAPINPRVDERLDWTNMEDVIASQRRSSLQPPKNFVKVNERYKDGNIIWIPSDDTQLKLRILIAGHTCIVGHRAWRTTKAAIGSHFFLRKMSNDVESFVKPCIHCL